ncbi:hypothetical protein [Burkholderia cepacia]|uniref:hypothetical protein n=1 Tax=Burkholderia cepacia TaxID=292 RepID=UPI001CF1A11A|nr:hypothetical protein [Burkholderia cepacia]MCA8355607.1 hypothetical protein [Burkholderia cepacia]
MKMTRTELIQLLDDTKRALLSEDSFEGRISYTCLTDSVDLGPDEFEVSAAIRVGNSMGQAGMILVQGHPEHVSGD